MTKHGAKQVRAGNVGRTCARLAAAVAAGVGWLAAAPAQAQDPFETSFAPSPNALLLLDTSGSMEYLKEEHKVPCCIPGDPLCNDPAKRTRWMMVQDALLGPVTDDTYKCLSFKEGQCVRQDYNEDCTSAAVRDERFWIPNDGSVPGVRWVIPQFQEYGTRNVPLGILERYRERVRFGVAFLDSYYSDDADHIDGMFSYRNGSEPLMWRGGATIDVGIRRAEFDADSDTIIEPGENLFGAFVGWGGDTTDMNVLNEKVREEIEQSFRYCGSPIAAALTDARYFLEHDPSNIPGGTD